jgi:hypothetical protein
MPEGDVVILSAPSGVRGDPPDYYIVLISKFTMVDLTNRKEFTSEDGTFRATQRGNEIVFDLGYHNRTHRTASQLVALPSMAAVPPRAGMMLHCSE